MKNLRYVGSSDTREFSPDDLKKLGVEGADQTLRFNKGESLTVDDKVAKAIMNQVDDMRESTDDELKQEEKDLEADLGFPLYNPAEYNAEDVKLELANSSDARRKYILDQEAAGKNRKSVFDAVGAEYDPNANMVKAEDDELQLDEAVAEAGGTTQTTGNATETTTTGMGNTSPTAGTGRASTA